MIKSIFQRLVGICTIAVLFLHCSKAGNSETSAAVISGQGGSTARFCITGNYMYTVDEQRLKAYDISNGQTPVLKSTVPVGFEIETIFPFNDKLFIGSTSQVYIFSIADPTQPTQLGTAISPNVMRRCDPVVAKDTVAFATLRTSGPCGGTQSILAIFDIKDVTNPIQKGVYGLNEPYGLGYSDTALYVCDRDLKIFSVANAYQPVLLKTISSSNLGGEFRDVICYQNTMICWVTNGIVLYDITDKSNPTFLSKIN